MYVCLTSFAPYEANCVNGRRRWGKNRRSIGCSPWAGENKDDAFTVRRESCLPRDTHRGSRQGTRGGRIRWKKMRGILDSFGTPHGEIITGRYVQRDTETNMKSNVSPLAKRSLFSTKVSPGNEAAGPIARTDARTQLANSIHHERTLKVAFRCTPMTTTAPCRVCTTLLKCIPRLCLERHEVLSTHVTGSQTQARGLQRIP